MAFFKNKKVIVWEFEGNSYNVNITYKRIKNVYFRYLNGEFYFSCSRLVSDNFILNILNKRGEKLLNKKNKRNPLYVDGKTYLFGEEFVTDLSLENFYNSLKKEYLSYLTERVRYFEKVMEISRPYKVRTCYTKRQFGSNSYVSHTISLSVIILHFSPEIIDSVIIHELTHEFQRNHGPLFYKKLLKYCPDYKIYRKKLINGIVK